MKIKKLVKKGLINEDHWLTKAQVKKEDVNFINGKVFWRSGIWTDGTWENGVWENGTWKDGVWKGGTWKDGIWKDGIWKDGIWKDGVWKRGTWKNGTWINGAWKDGLWENGFWRNGTWKNGWELFGRNKWKTSINRKKGLLKVGCKVKTYKEWEEWLSSKEEFQTPRDSKAFKLIERTIKEAILILKMGE